VSPLRLHRTILGSLLAAVLATSAAGCASTSNPRLKVLAVEPQRRTEPSRSVMLYVEVSNPASRPMRLQKLQNTFAASGERAASAGEVSLTRTIDPGAAVVVEVPVTIEGGDLSPGETLTLRGKLYAELDRMVRTFSVSADVSAPAAQH
jgi:hypothetical protein